MSDVARVSVPEATRALAEAISGSEEYVSFAGMKEAVMRDDTSRALLKEYQRLQSKLQLAAMTGAASGEDDVQRFSQMTSLLYANADTARYLLAQLRLQKLIAEVFQSVSKASGLEFELPGM